MQALGYEFVNLDDCWAYSRDNTTGRLTWDEDRFPSGIPALADWLHERGFKFGLYTSGGDQTCSSGGRDIQVPGSEGYFETDVQTFADWGVDYVKLDWCGNVKHQPWKGPHYHREFGQAMLDSDRPMFLETVAGYFFLGKEISTYANSWRFCEDHHDEWESTLENMLCRFDQSGTAVTAGESGAWPYMDFLMSGGQGCAPYVEGEQGVHCPQQTDDMYRTEFAVWSITQSPLVVSTDVRNLTTVMTETLLNEELLALHQNTSFPPGKILVTNNAGCTACQIWGRQLGPSALSGWVVALVNPKSDTENKVTLDWSTLGLKQDATVGVRDLWMHTDLTDATGPTYSATVAAGGALVLKVTPQ